MMCNDLVHYCFVVFPYSFGIGNSGSDSGNDSGSGSDNGSGSDFGSVSGEW